MLELILMGLYAALSVRYAWNGAWYTALYWFASILITLSITKGMAR